MYTDLFLVLFSFFLVIMMEKDCYCSVKVIIICLIDNCSCLKVVHQRRDNIYFKQINFSSIIKETLSFVYVTYEFVVTVVSKIHLSEIRDVNEMPLVFSGVRATRSLVLCVCFIFVLIVVCPFVSFLSTIVLSVLLSFGHCVVCSSSNYGF